MCVVQYIYICVIPNLFPEKLLLCVVGHAFLKSLTLTFGAMKNLFPKVYIYIYVYIYVIPIYLPICLPKIFPKIAPKPWRNPPFLTERRLIDVQSHTAAAAALGGFDQHHAVAAAQVPENILRTMGNPWEIHGKNPNVWEN